LNPKLTMKQIIFSCFYRNDFKRCVRRWFRWNITWGRLWEPVGSLWEPLGSLGEPRGVSESLGEPLANLGEPLGSFW